MTSCLKMKKRTKGETPFMKNGRLLLEELIASCDGRCNPIRTFSAKELKKATNNYDHGQRIIIDCNYTLYKGFLEDRPISVKKYEFLEEQYIGLSFTDVVVGLQMNVHKNVLKLIGCCLETKHLIIVYEFIGNQTLRGYLSLTNEMQSQSLPWKCRMKIAVDVANAIAYLHTSLYRPVVHRDIKPSNIMLDANYVARLTDFALSIAIPEGETEVVEDQVVGTFGYLAPETLRTGSYTEKVDVYSFGVVLIQLLTGKAESCGCFFVNGDRIDAVSHVKNHFANNRFEEILDPVIVAEGPWSGKEQQLNNFIALALRCVHDSSDNRPTMIEVGKELRQIYQSVISP